MSKMSENKVICITGTIGSGKSSVSKIIQNSGLPVLDLDAVVNALYYREDVIKKVNTLLFGEESNILNKEKIKLLIFNNEEKRTILENYLYPLVFNEMQQFIAKHHICFVEMALVFEKKWEQYFDEIICVVTNKKTATKRLKKYRNLTLQDIQKRQENQFNSDIKMANSDYIIFNNSDEATLQKKVYQYLKERRLYE